MPRPIKPRPIETIIGPSIAYVPLTQDKFALIDADDAERVGTLCWHVYQNNTSGNWYARRRDGEKRQPLHSFILGVEEGKTVDHINNSATLDNRKCNLRHASANLQVWNRRMLRSNTSGITGVHFEKNKNLWRAVIIHHNKRIGLGRFKNQLDAAHAYNEAARKLRGGELCQQP